MRLLVTICTAGLLSGLAARASSDDVAAARACAAIADPTSRLACYDAAFPPRIPPQQAQFGDNSQLQKQRSPRVETPKFLQAAVKTAISLPLGRYQLTLDNGQVWQTHEADWTLVFKSDDTIEIARLPLGGYQISKPGNGHSVGAKRIQ
jgi:hypothetical protein